MKQTTKQDMTVKATVEQQRNANLPVRFKNLYRFECLDADGNLRWTTAVPNLVVDTGLNDVLDKYFLGSAYTASFFVGLKGTGAVVAGDTISSHAGWLEVTVYSQATRPALTLAAVSGKSTDNSANKAVFSITTATSVAGAFVVNNNTKGGATGILYGAADFTVPRTVADGDTLNVTATLAATAT